MKKTMKKTTTKKTVTTKQNNSAPMVMGVTREVDYRKARVDYNHVPGDPATEAFAVFMHTFYLGRWYYDGYRHFPTQDAAAQWAIRWLNGEEKTG